MKTFSDEDTHLNELVNTYCHKWGPTVLKGTVFLLLVFYPSWRTTLLGLLQLLPPVNSDIARFPTAYLAHNGNVSGTTIVSGPTVTTGHPPGTPPSLATRSAAASLPSPPLSPGSLPFPATLHHHQCSWVRCPSQSCHQAHFSPPISASVTMSAFSLIPHQYQQAGSSMPPGLTTSLQLF